MQMPSPCDHRHTPVHEKLLPCTAASQQVEEALIGTAPPCQIYIFIECPFPWTSQAFESKMIPQNLKALVQRLVKSNLSIRCFLINRGQIPGDRPPSDQQTILIYQRPSDRFCKTYKRSSFQVTCLEQVAAVIRCYLSGQVSIAGMYEPDARDLFICTHGSRDQCCGRYGMPFYREAINTVRSLYMNQELDQTVNLWHVSHIGGHRFAPTLLDLPDGRYYGRLNSDRLNSDRLNSGKPNSSRLNSDKPSHDVLTSILTRKGNLQHFSLAYRGWSILPESLQPLELELMLQHGWDWFDCKVTQPILTQTRGENWIKAELLVEHPNKWVKHYQAELVKDEQKTVHVKASCHDNSSSEFTKYSVKSLSCCSTKQPFQLSA